MCGGREGLCGASEGLCGARLRGVGRWRDCGAEGTRWKLIESVRASENERRETEGEKRKGDGEEIKRERR